MGKRCSKGKSCGASCIQRLKTCRVDLGQSFKGDFENIRKEIKGGSADKLKEIERLEKRREQVSDGFHKLFSKDRGDGEGTHFENPSAKTYDLLKKFQSYTEDIDSKLNRLEGKKLITAVGSDGKKFKHEPKRWYEDKHNLGRFRGFTSDARKKFEENLIETLLKKGEKSDNPQAIFMMGGPASGKTSLLKKMFGGDPKGFLSIDPDHIKSMLPEFMFGAGSGDQGIAGKVHVTSSRIAREVLERAKERGFNVLWDGTGNDKGLYTRQARELRNLGYTTQLIAQHIPEKEGVKRAVARANLPVSKGGGRFVPLHFIQDAYQNVPRNFEPLAKLFDSATISDSASGKEIMRYSNGEVTAENKGMARRFRRAYGEGT